MTTVAFNEFSADPPELRELEIAACQRVIASGWWILGPEVKRFENAWRDRIGCSSAIGCGNGMDAIEIALRALRIGPGAEVITTAMTAFATALAILRVGATPVLADIDPATALLDPQSVRRCITPRTRAIILVHLYGQVGAVRALQDLAQDAGVDLIEDCAQSHGASLGGRSVGTFGIASAWSFYPTKNLGAVGDAGALCTNSTELFELASMLRNYGQSDRYHHPHVGLNSRLDEMQAALLSCRLNYLDRWIARRRVIAERYHGTIRNPFVRPLPAPEQPEQHVYHLFVVTCQKRSELQQHLKGSGISSLIHYPIPIHGQAPCSACPRDPEGLPIAERHAETCLSLPCHPAMSDDQVEYVTRVVNDFR